MMNRAEAFRVLDACVGDDIVVATYSSAHEWIAINHRPLNYYSFGAMGLASSHGIGLALALPDRRVIVLDGDGSLLMNLGTLVTMAAAAPRNLVHIVCQNGSYEANGGHPIVNPQVDFIGIARSSGISATHRIGALEAFKAEIRGILRQDGPVFCLLDIEQGPMGPREYEDMYSPARRAAFRAALGSARE